MDPPKQRTTSFFPTRKLKGNQPLLKKPTICLAHLEEEEVDDGEDPESDDAGGIEGVMEEFMVQLARVAKDAQADEKHCYHCSSPEHFISNFPLMKTSRDKKAVKQEGGDGVNEGSPNPSDNNKNHKEPPRQMLPRHKTHIADSLLEFRPFSVMVQD